MSDAAFRALASMGRALSTSVPDPAEWKWDDSARVALVVLTVEEVATVYSALAQARADDWTVESVGDCPEAVGVMVGEMGGLRPGQHVFSAEMDPGDFVYLASWPWNDQVHVSVRFGVYYSTGSHDDSAVHTGLIKRGLKL